MNKILCTNGLNSFPDTKYRNVLAFQCKWFNVDSTVKLKVMHVLLNLVF